MERWRQIVLVFSFSCMNWSVANSFEEYFNRFFTDFFDLHRELFSVESMKPALWFVPAYVAARSVDDEIHSTFYQRTTHGNRSQLPKGLQSFISKSVPTLAAALSVTTFFKNLPENFRETSDLYVKGVISVSVLRTILKNSLRGRGALRPWNENFSSQQRALGGFPSGHMATIMYTATLYGLRHGPKFGVPLSALSAFVFGASANGNRHYVSQLVGGAAIGFTYALATNRLLQSRLADSLEMDITAGTNGGASLSLSYSF